MGGVWLRAARAVALALLVAVAATACSDRGSATPDPTLPRRTTTTDPFAVPDPIDVAYVERVMAALDHLYGDAAREVAREKELTPRFEDLMRAIYADEEQLRLTMAIWEAERERRFSTLASRPGDRSTKIIALLASDESCILAEIEQDLSPLLKQSLGTRPEREFLVLVPSPSSAVNPTPWRISFEGFTPDGDVPEVECAEP